MEYLDLQHLVLWRCFILLVIPTLLRRKTWELFQFSHLVFAPLGIIFASLHHSHFLILISISLILYLIDLIIRIIKFTVPVKLVSITPMGKITKLVLRAPHINSRPGQYVFIWISSISLFESHPFTISLVEDGNIVLFIKSMGRGTFSKKILEMARNFEDGKTSHPMIRFLVKLLQLSS